MMATDANGGCWTTTAGGAVTQHDGAPALGSPARSGLLQLESHRGYVAPRRTAAAPARRLRWGYLQLRQLGVPRLHRIYPPRPSQRNRLCAWTKSNNVARACFIDYDSGGSSSLADDPNSLVARKADLG